MVCISEKARRRRRLEKENTDQTKQNNNEGLKEKTEQVRHSKRKKNRKRKKGGKQRKHEHADKEGERERSATASLVWTCRESEVFRRCNLRRFRFRSLWQNTGPPALQLMWATSKLMRAKTENRCFTKAWDLRPKTAHSAPLAVWHLQCVWVHMCVSQPGGIQRVLKQLSVLREMNLLEAVNALIVVPVDRATVSSPWLSFCLFSPALYLCKHLIFFVFLFKKIFRL